MKAGRILTIVGIAVVASGCASGKSAQQMKQLQTQVGMLDERLGQLERWTYSSAPAGTTTSADASSTRGMSVSVGGTSAAAPKKPAATTAKVSPKPSAREIQQALKNAGFYQGAVDGKMGPQTREAIKEFQRVHGLKDDGIVGKQTWAKLGAYGDMSGGNGELNAAEVLK